MKSGRFQNIYNGLFRQDRDRTGREGRKTSDVPIPDERTRYLITAIKDWQLTHGSLLKSVQGEDEHSVSARPIGVSIVPTPFPRERYEQACGLAEIYNKLYCAVSDDEQWLFETVKAVISANPLAAILWDVHTTVKELGYVQHMSLGFFRSDYMLDLPASEGTEHDKLSLKQVEFNTFDIAGGTHSNIVADMHQHLRLTGVYDNNEPAIEASMLPANDAVKSLVAGLQSAHNAYGPPRSGSATTTAVLFVVQPRNVNICDERPLEYALWHLNPSIPAYRCLFRDIMLRTTLSKSRELLFHPIAPSRATPVEISVAYLRAGIHPEEYNAGCIAARLQLERSRAIKCPSILGHFLTFKKVQQALAVPGALERFLSPDEAALVARTFAPMYPMDETEAGQRGRQLALAAGTAANHVLKPSLEGGGHNIYGTAIPKFLASIPESDWSAYILMEMIHPPVVHGSTMSQRGLHFGPVVSELGIISVCLWEQKQAGEEARDGRARLIQNFRAGWTLKSKAPDVTEMSVVKGWGCFDSPHLIAQDDYLKGCSRL